MRKAAIIIGIIIAVIIGILLVAPLFINVNQYRPQIQSELQQRLGRKVTFGNLHLRLLTPRLRVDNLTISDDPRFSSGRPFAQAQELDVSVALLPLISKKIEVNSLTLQQPDIELVRNAQGVWNFSTIGQAGGATQPQPRVPRQPAPAQKPAPPNQPSSQQNAGAFELKNLQISAGQIAITDYQKRQPRTLYNNIDLSLSNFAPGKPFSVSATVHLPGAGTQVVSLDGTGGPINQSNMVATPFDGDLKLQQVALSAAQKFLNTPALAGTDATLSGGMKIRNQAGNLASRGTLKLQNPVIHGIALGYPISADYDISDDLNSGVLNISKATLHLGSTPLSIAGNMNMKTTPAQVNVQLRASDVSLGEVARLASAMGVAFAPGMNINGRLNADVHAQGTTTSPALNGTISARNLNISGKGLPQAVTVPAVDLTMTPTQVSSNEFTASTAGTKLSTQFTLNGYAGSSPAISASVRTSNAQVGDLINIGKAYGATSLQGMSGSGTLSLNLHASGPLKNASAMSFSGTGQLANASLKMPSLTQPLNVRSADLKFTQNSMAVDKLVASLGQSTATGNLTMRDFAAPQVQFDIMSPKIDVVQLQQITAARPAPQKRAAWSVLPRAYAGAPPQPSLLTRMTGTGTLMVGTILYDQLVLNNVRSNVKLNRGLITLSPLTSQVYGGQETGAIVLDARQTPMAVQVQSKLANVDANKLVSSVTSIKQTLYGLLAANTNMGFAAASSADMARTLNGTFNLDLTKGRIVGIDLLHELGNVGKFLSGTPATSQPVTNLLKLTGTFNVHNGLAQTNNLQALIEGGSLGATGAVNLVNNTLNLHLTAVLSKWFSNKVGGTNVGGFMNTALANQQGELVIPVLVTGTFQHPIVAPDVQKLAQMKLQRVLPTTANPALGQAVGALLGDKNGQKPNVGNILGAIAGQAQRQQPANSGPAPAQPQPGQTQNQQQPKANPLGNVLNQIFGGKKQQQQQQQQPQKPQ
ncbi:MAG TPA: AsmA family protein [Terriglobales bacterium]|nr:AsmA family protein [Terriglobales bacterium]